MTKRMYYDNSYIKTFSTQVIKQKQDEAGKWFVVLEETAFYPTGGGQPYDVGTLNEVSVVQVEEIDGEIRHYITAPIQEEVVKGNLNWDRRFDHMQQHAGQHILSAAFAEQFGFETVSFHLGQETITIDIQTEFLTDEQASQVEKRANQIILENRPINTEWVTEAEANRYPLRKKLSVSDNIRLVIIPDFDYNGCGGTHPSSTGQVTGIKILGWEKQKKNTRVEFVCGNRVRHQLHNKNKVLNELGRLLSSSEQEMTIAVTRLLEQGKTMEKTVEELREQLLHFEAAGILSKGYDGFVYELFHGRTMQDLQKLARITTSQDETVSVLFVTENVDKLQIVMARGKKASGNMKSLIGKILPTFNGKGGGNEVMAQGGGDVGSISGQELLKLAIETVKDQLVG